jgi:hypothetical protein
MHLSRRVRWVLVAALLVLAVVAIPTASAPAGENPCPQAANQPAVDGPVVKPEIGLESTTTGEVLNFDGTRGIKSLDVVIGASRAIPRSITAKQLEIDSPKRFKRVSDKLESTTLRLPTFSKPQFIEHRNKIRFRACFDTTDAPAGIYTGQIIVSGPPGFGPVTVSPAINAKDGCSFWRDLTIALLIAFVFLLLRAAKEEREKSGDKIRWRDAAKTNLKNPLFVVSTTVALATAFIAMHAIYAADPAWGADPWAALFAICGAGFSAAGIGSLISTFSPSKEATNE